MLTTGQGEQTCDDVGRNTVVPATLFRACIKSKLKVATYRVNNAGFARQSQ